MKLDTVLGYTKQITLQSTLECLDIASYDLMHKMIQCLYSRKATEAIQIVVDIYKAGKDLKLFVRDLNKYVLDLCKFELTHDFNLTLIPGDYTREVDKFVAKCGIDFLVDTMDSLNNLENKIKYESNPKSIVESEVMLLCLK